MNNDLISREALKKTIDEVHQKDLKINPMWGSIGLNTLNRLIDNAPTVEPVKQCKYCKHCGNEDYCSNCHSDHSLFEYYERPQGECRTCRHRDPEDKKCDCGGQERLGCPFPVSNDYYCKYYEKGCGAE